MFTALNCGRVVHSRKSEFQKPSSVNEAVLDLACAEREREEGGGKSHVALSLSKPCTPFIHPKNGSYTRHLFVRLFVCLFVLTSINCRTSNNNITFSALYSDVACQMTTQNIKLSLFCQIRSHQITMDDIAGSKDARKHNRHGIMNTIIMWYRLTHVQRQLDSINVCEP